MFIHLVYVGDKILFISTYKDIKIHNFQCKCCPDKDFTAVLNLLMPGHKSAIPISVLRYSSRITSGTI